jgi:hypothetical protein
VLGNWEAEGYLVDVDAVFSLMALKGIVNVVGAGDAAVDLNSIDLSPMVTMFPEDGKSPYRGVPQFWTHRTKRMHALKGLACRKRVAAASSPAATCKQCAALTSPACATRLQLRQAFSRTLVSQR